MSQNKDVPLREVLTLQLFFMRIDILTVLPEMIEGMINCSIVKRAQDKGLAEIHLHNLRDYTTNKWRRVDDYPFGGEAGMVMQIEPIDRAISALKSEREYDEVIYTSPDGETLNQPMANSMSLLNNMIILCGHYKGIDYRIREHLITKEISVGDYVLTGGELAAAIITDAVVRLIPGAIGDEQSALSDSFQDDLLAPPVYTRPADYKGWKVQNEIALMLGGTIGMGVLIIIFGMVLNVINALKSKELGEALFGHNGVAGLVFYIGALLLAGNLFLKWGIPTFVFVAIIILAVLCMYLCEPLGKLVEGKKDWLPRNGMFFVENLFEMFEVILSFFTNTISFLRIGAFAIVHVGMMMVVAILSQSGGVGGVIVQVIGNVLVMVLEGLIVGIQVLRLEYYEMFSRYFSGRGKEFMSLRDK